MSTQTRPAATPLQPSAIAHGDLTQLRLSRVDDFRFQRGIDLLLAAGARIEPGMLWLDLGCHQGQLLRKLIDRHGVRAIGMDDWDTDTKAPHDSDWDYLQADLDRELPWTEAADIISALEVLEHMIDTDTFLARAHARLKPGGWILISTPNINSLRNRASGVFGAYPTGLEFRTVIHHVRLYNVTMLKRHLADSGFRDIKIGGVSFLPLARPGGTSRLSCRLATLWPQLCNNIIAVARKPPAQ